MDMPEILSGDFEVAGKKIPKVAALGLFAIGVFALTKLRGGYSGGVSGGSGEASSNGAIFGGDVASSYAAELANRLGNEQTRQYTDLQSVLKGGLDKAAQDAKAQSDLINKRIDDIKIPADRPIVINTPRNDFPRFPIPLPTPRTFSEWLERQTDLYKQWYKSRPQARKLEIQKTARAAGLFITEKPTTTGK